jgi:hypothetical protein
MIMMMLLEEGVSWIPKEVRKDKKERTEIFFSSMRRSPPSPHPLCAWMMMILEEGVSWITKQVSER